MDEILKLLHWDRREDEQAEGLALAEGVQNLKGFFQPMGENGGKPVWDNCALVLSRRSDEELEPYLGDMLLWLQDTNWPGAGLILQRLRAFQDQAWLAGHLRQLIPYLLWKQDAPWAMGVAELCREPELQSQLDGQQVSQLLELTEAD